MYKRLSLLIAILIYYAGFCHALTKKRDESPQAAMAAHTLFVRIVDASNSQQIQNVGVQIRFVLNGKTMQYRTGLEQVPQFALDQKGRYEVTCSAEGFETNTAIVDVSGSKTNIIVRLHARPASAEVSFVAISATDRFTGQSLIPDVSLNGRRFTSFEDLKTNNGKDNILTIAVDDYPSLYHTVTPAEIQAQQITVVMEATEYPFRFTVLSADNRQPIEGAEMSWASAISSETAHSQSIKGKSQVRLSRETSLNMEIKADGFETYWEKFESEKFLQAHRFDHEILLTRSKAVPAARQAASAFDLKKGQRITLQHIYFDQSSPVLRPESSSELDKLADALNASPELKIEIRGHTDNVGNFNANVKLSRERCESVVKYLFEKGVGKDRLRYVGKGPLEPLAPNTTEENKKKNRRVEFIVL
jgi:outer membrane protein OmpA-like peptidoglycan-associated protein